MRAFRTVIVVGILVAVAGLSAVSAAEPIKGYLSDGLCGKTGYVDGYKGNENFNLTKSPEKNIVMCQIMENCAKSGYGLYIRQADGTFKFSPFDARGSELATSQVLKGIKDQSSPAPYLEVTGTLSNGIITVTSIKVVKAPTDERAKSGDQDSGMMKM
jgi:hypothetical protein